MEVRERKSKGRLGHLKCYEKGGARLCELTTQGMARELISTTFVSDLLTMGDGSHFKCSVRSYDSIKVITLISCDCLGGTPMKDASSIDSLSARVWTLEFGIGTASHGETFFALPEASMVKVKPPTPNAPKEFQFLLIKQPGPDCYALHDKEGLVGQALIPSLDLSKMLRKRFSAGTCNQQLFSCKFHVAFGKWIPVCPARGNPSSRGKVRLYLDSVE